MCNLSCFLYCTIKCVLFDILSSPRAGKLSTIFLLQKSLLQHFISKKGFSFFSVHHTGFSGGNSCAFDRHLETKHKNIIDFDKRTKKKHRNICFVPRPYTTRIIKFLDFLKSVPFVASENVKISHISKKKKNVIFCNVPFLFVSKNYNKN